MPAMELYYSPFACSLASHIVVLEAELPVTMRRIDLMTKRTDAGASITELNPMGQVPTLVTREGRVLTENAAVLLYLGDLAPERGLTPALDSFERYEIVRWLSFIATELHKRINFPVFMPDTPPEVKAYARASGAQPLAVIERHLSERETLLGRSFSVADAYLYWALTLFPRAGIPLEPFKAVSEYYARHRERTSVRTAFRIERQQLTAPTPNRVD